ncbi:pancreatic lipase-related protein 2 [Halyomorpha halys]|uniref:pancreatic lipase-related protein 2 n=1 Tax=Halyomorpha halys TaxID=286706 RepID=UPI0006D51C10|nr:pancreatic lipase-related protein 2-like [Halyomorpha halys]
MTQNLLVITLLFVQVLDSFGGVPRPQHWGIYKNLDGKMVYVNFDSANSPNNEVEVIDTNKVQFHLYTKENPKVSQRLYLNDSLALNSSNYNFKDQTKFIVHGFFNDINSETIQAIKNNFLNQSSEGYNVIGVDWSYYTYIYTNVLYKAKGVGKIIGEMVDFLVLQGSKLEDMHLIGHSLGAQACGFAGASLNKRKVARISGLDPALPGFDVAKPEDRLDAQDAQFVDCIHTCGGNLGIFDPICTADYYPNGGQEQPGCSWFDFGSCNHGRSHQFFAESIIESHEFPAQSCLSMDFGKGECVDKGALMGYPATKRFIGIFYSVTNSEYPFSMNISIVK